jgi:hypothetical protein
MPPALMAKFKKANLPIVAVIDYTAATDVNHLLGRPGGYIAKDAWIDRRISPPPTEIGDVDSGGSIETFSSSQAAQARASEIEALRNGGFLGTEYHFLVGTSLIRVTSALTPAQAAAYQRAATS